MTSRRRREHVVVIGASVGGLLAARVLSRRYRRVTLVDRDSLPRSAEHRKGVPQGRHAHAILARGRRILEDLYPGITAALVEQGAPRGSGRFYVGGGFLSPPVDLPDNLFASRPLLEAEVRKRTRQLDNVEVVEDCSVEGLLYRADTGGVTGVRLAATGGSSVPESLAADLVVDASGRGSRTPVWLEQLGFRRPPAERIEVQMGYTSRTYRRRPDDFGGDLMLNVSPTRSNKRGCGMLAQEGDRWMVTLVGYFGDMPPTDADGFLEFARSLPVPDVFGLIRSAEPLTDAVPYRFPADERRRYDRVPRFPTGLLVLADALASFTPIYGQGMTVAAMEAIALGECLDAGDQKLARRFFSRANQVVDRVWAITAGGDFGLFENQGEVPRSFRVMNRYISRLQVAARRDPVVAGAFLRAANLVDPPSALLRPSLAARVFSSRFRYGHSPEPVSGWGDGERQ